jgi:alpha-beta hydrolase superfamily lysophospholipase
MFPRIADEFAKVGFVAIRFNFSHSGMTNDIATFARPDLFERDSWNKQVHDLRTVIEVAAAGSLGNFTETSLPYIIFGHSRGGVTALLTAGRYADDPSFAQPAGIITAAAPSRCNFLAPEQEHELDQRGFIDSPSSRTGQNLRISRTYSDEMRADRAGHDVQALVGKIRCPLLIVHGRSDPTVPASAATDLAQAARTDATILLLAVGDHVFNTPNPMPLPTEFSQNASMSPQLATLLEHGIAFANRCCTEIKA